MPGIRILEGKYSATMDLYPLEVKEFNRIYPFYEFLKEGRFTTTRCKDCGHQPFPPRVICPECLSEDLEWVDLPKRGVVQVVTEQYLGVPLGFEVPLIHALIDLQGCLTIFSRILNCRPGQLKEGDEVELCVFPIDPLPIQIGKDTVVKERVFYGFEPIKPAG